MPRIEGITEWLTVRSPGAEGHPVGSPVRSASMRSRPCTVTRISNSSGRSSTATPRPAATSATSAASAPIGVTATKDPDEIVALDADCVLYMPQGEMNPMGALDDICRLLASGKNVVSTAVTALIYPLSIGRQSGGQARGRLRRGQTSFHAHRHRTGLGRRGVAADDVGTVPAHRLAVGAGADGLHHVRQRRHAVRHHGIRQGARRTGADGRRRAGRCDVQAPR